MHRISAFATIAFLLLAAAPSFAQSTGINVMSALGESIRREMPECQVIGTRDMIRVIDRKSGDVVLTVSETNPLNVAIIATIGSYPGMSREVRARMMERIARFNFSSIVGTLEFDERSGNIIMSHNLNPSAVNLADMAHVAALCNAVAREQSQVMLK